LASMNIFWDSLDQIVDEATTVYFVPTGVTLQSGVATALRSVKLASVDETLISSLSSDNQLVEESVLTLIHDKSLEWILPGVKPTNRRLVVPLCVSASLVQGKLDTVRLYWDQASVLRQIGVLPATMYCKANSSEVTLPIVGVRIADQLLQSVDPNHLQVAPSAAEPESRPSSGMIPGSNHPSYESKEISRPSTRVFHQPKTADIFGSYERVSTNTHGLNRRDPNASSLDIPVAAEPSSRSRSASLQRKTPNMPSVPESEMVAAGFRPQSAERFSLSDNSSEASYHSGKKYVSGSNASHFSINGDSVAGATPPHPRRHMSAHTNDSHFSFGGASSGRTPFANHGKKHYEDTNSSSWHMDGSGGSSAPVRPGRKMSSSSSGGVESGQFTVSAYEDGKAQPMQDGKPYAGLQGGMLFGGDTYERPSSRVLNAPGGRSTFTIA